MLLQFAFYHKNGRFERIFGFNFFVAFFLSDKVTFQKTYNNKCFSSMSSLLFGVHFIKKFQFLWILWLEKHNNLVNSMIFSKIIGISLFNLCQTSWGTWPCPGSHILIFMLIADLSLYRYYTVYLIKIMILKFYLKNMSKLVWNYSINHLHDVLIQNIYGFGYVSPLVFEPTGFTKISYCFMY